MYGYRAWHSRQLSIKLSQIHITAKYCVKRNFSSEWQTFIFVLACLGSIVVACRYINKLSHAQPTAFYNVELLTTITVHYVGKKSRN